jgi:hypothetical protein
MTSTANGTFDTSRCSPVLQNSTERSAASSCPKTFHGDLQGAGTGVMLSAGDPPAGAAGYVAIETVHGRLGEQEGSFALQQFGTMHDGPQTLQYEVVPGSGTGQLSGVTGTLHLDINDDGTHRYELDHDL